MILDCPDAGRLDSRLMRENVYATVAGLGLGTGLGTLFFGQIFVGSLLVLGSATLGMWVIERNKSS